ncbi:hypothetical protein CSUB01_11915 [Colletotrichum sublineola]|uniref:Uncharacterized protein n=1 Tax=Colletotrichum sublineola TaxID=1173701 RepID=A0A066Y104_COLSU|nr:hypothetical protein CSUB01_11915 [Colletotrichum sublineola]
MFGLGFLTFATAIMRVVSVRARLGVAGPDPLDLQLCVSIPFLRLMMVRKIIPYTKDKFITWFMPDNPPPTSQQSMIRPEMRQDRDMEEIWLSRDDELPQLIDISGLLSNGGNSQHVQPSDTNESPETEASRQVASGVEKDANGGRDEKDITITALKPTALRRYGFVSKAVMIDEMPLAWDSKGGEMKQPKEIKRRSL